MLRKNSLLTNAKIIGIDREDKCIPFLKSSCLYDISFFVLIFKLLIMITIKAFAKINLGLEILYKRDDGFHELNTVFFKTCLSDTLGFHYDNNIIVTSKPDLGIPQEQNLVYKAATLLKQQYPDTPGCRIHIEKYIPTGAGLGGGSSDAATTLLGLSKLWRIKPPKNILHHLACKLGSDVPFFLTKNTAQASGRGEQLEYFDFKLPWWLLLIYPNIQISTKWAYKNLELKSIQRTPSDLKDILNLSLTKPELLKNKIFNDFENIVFSANPEIRKIKKAIYSSGALFSLLSGSGSTVFGFFESKESCDAASLLLKNYYTFICPPKK